MAKAAKKTSGVYRRLSPKEAAEAHEEDLHVYGKKVKCITDTRGFASPRTPDGRTRIVVDASEGFIPLWAKNSTLRWRFQEHSMKVFADPPAAKVALRDLLGDAILAWGDAVPVKFAERKDAWDFEISVRNADDCDINGCVLASAFFPDSGRHEIVIYPMMLQEPRSEQVATLAHEIGHVFGLRHFFAKVGESAWPSEIFGKHKPFTIMNYGTKSVLTKADRTDLKNLYLGVWAKEITDINGTEVRLVRPFHYS